MTTNPQTAQLGTIALRLPQVTRRWLPFIAVIALALVVRLYYMADPAYRGDLRHFAAWLRVIEQNGVFNFYQDDLRFGVWDRTYPPLSTLAFGALLNIYGDAPSPRTALDQPNFVILLKLLPVAAELVLIGAVYLWIKDPPLLRWLIPGLLALYPGLIATSAWWGQYDSVFTVFLVLALICLNRDRPLWAWLLFTIAVLLKQPAIVLAPLLLVITFRRYGWRMTAQGIIASSVLTIVIFTPFVLNSGLVDALSPFLKAGDTFPNLTNNAYNFWYGLAGIHNGGWVSFQDPQYRDSVVMFGGITYKFAGFFLLGTYTLLLMILFWRQANERREFVWAAALFFGFFMLPTQVHERYLYPAAVFIVIAIVQDRRMWWIALGLMGTFSYNILAVLMAAQGRSAYLLPGMRLPAALFNVAFLVLLVRWTLLLQRQPVVAHKTAAEHTLETSAAASLKTAS